MGKMAIKWIYLLYKEMSSASNSKSKDKKAGKETSKASLKSAGSAIAASAIPASAYNPMSGTFHTFESVPTSSGLPLRSNGRFRNMDETDEHVGGSLVSGVEYDSVSNNGSWSGESEDHKEKTYYPVRQEIIPGADNDKREKIRQKNEKKHQRQKERRAQELQERSSGYLMSRKLEALSQQLVAMGFSHERATMALIMNEGKVEQSVAWLFEGGEEADKNKDLNPGGGNLKIDISEELAWIEDMEMMYRCTKQEVQRAVVAAEGDLEKAAETLRAMKEEPPSAPSKPEETGDHPTSDSDVLSVSTSCNLEVRSQLKPNLPTMQQKRDEKDFNHAKAAVTVGVTSQSNSKNVPPLKRIEPKLEWAKLQKTVVPSEKRWTTTGTNSSGSYSLMSPLQSSPPTAKAKTRYILLGSEMKNLSPTVREPVIMMQQPQSLTAKHVQPTSVSLSPPGAAASWNPKNNVENMKSNGFMSHIPSTSTSTITINSNQMYHPLHYHQQQQYFIPNSSPEELNGNIYGNTSSRTGSAPTISAASSLGLFSGLGSTGTSGSSPVDWSTAGSLAQFDYTNIDWSLNQGLYSPRPGRLWSRTSFVKNSHIYDSNSNPLSVKPTFNLSPASGNGVPILGLKDGVVSNSDSSAAGSREWTSPFEEKDLFSLPRQFVSSPPL
ncbi:uncharacterized protein LOC123225871 isoform X2 [Mangifera indica]|uniref:uncharacterized protein LOC123225871 isoform X2 n=1 Tax=Mangifera indica TaxID=29780 RepID=UPI001CFBD313|nr:uncharacterized protein LOC123225871 isoform X2 [Mangifera indica]